MDGAAVADSTIRLRTPSRARSFSIALTPFAAAGHLRGTRREGARPPRIASLVNSPHYLTLAARNVSRQGRWSQSKGVLGPARPGLTWRHPLAEATRKCQRGECSRPGVCSCPWGYRTARFPG